MNEAHKTRTFKDFSRASWNTGLECDRQAAIQQWLEDAGMTRRDLAATMGVDPALITLIFQGKRRITEQRRIAFQALGFPMHLLDTHCQEDVKRKMQKSQKKVRTTCQD